MKTIFYIKNEVPITIIHPADPSTDFLGALYPPQNYRYTEEDSGKKISSILNHSSQVLLLGHGNEEGLLAPTPDGNPYGRLIVSKSHRYYLRRIPWLIGIWCNSDVFASKLGLEGLFSGMIISELSEAQELGILTNQEELTRENSLWAQRLGSLLWSTPLPEIPRIFKDMDTSKTELTIFNYSSLRWMTNR